LEEKSSRSRSVSSTRDGSLELGVVPAGLALPAG
jgi:hypothetical protein